VASGVSVRLFDTARAFRFSVVGIAATLTYLGLVNGLAAPIGTLSTFEAHLIGLSTGIVVSYLGHHAYTFRRKGRHGFYFWRFVAITAILFVAASAIAYAGDRWLGLPALVISLVVTVLYPAGSYLLHTLWTFAGAERTV
jgi:putative flippase GtrA